MKTAIKIICIIAVVALSVMPTTAVAMRSSPDAEFEWAMKKGAKARLEIRVVDDEGAPVSNATVNVLFNMLTPGGGEIVTVTTDTNSVAVAEGKTNLAIRYRIEKEGYYKSEDGIKMYNMSHRYEVKDGKWQPWGMEKKIVLKPCKKRVPIINSWKICDIPSTNVWYGFDFAKNDFVTPHGSGNIADFRLMFEWDGKKPSRRPFTALHIAFDEPFGGGYHVDKHLQSSFPYVYGANTNDLFATKSINYGHRYEGVPGQGTWVGNAFDDQKSLVVRSRCKVDENGKLVSANYSNITKIEYSAGWEGKGVFTIAYFFNPMPNDPNLEPK